MDVKEFHIFLEMFPVAQIPCTVRGKLTNLLDLTDYLLPTVCVFWGILLDLGLVLVPHAFYEERQILPVESVTETVQLALQNFEVVWIHSFLL